MQHQFGKRTFAIILRTIRALLAWCALASALMLPLLAGGHTVQYAYDEEDRLIQAVAPDGRSAQFTYDAVGNIRANKQNAATAVSIAELTPNAGPAGTVVNIYGSGFNSVAASNTVKFNGVTATVSASTANSLTVVVPPSASPPP